MNPSVPHGFKNISADATIKSCIFLHYVRHMRLLSRSLSDTKTILSCYFQLNCTMMKVFQLQCKLYGWYAHDGKRLFTKPFVHFWIIQYSSCLNLLGVQRALGWDMAAIDWGVWVWVYESLAASTPVGRGWAVVARNSWEDLQKKCCQPVKKVVNWVKKVLPIYNMKVCTWVSRACYLTLAKLA